MFPSRISTFESHSAAAWDAESEIGDIADVPNAAATPTLAGRGGFRPPAIERGPVSTNPPRRGSDNWHARGRGFESPTRRRGRGRGVDRGACGRVGSHRGGGATRGNLSGNTGRGGHQNSPIRRGNGRSVEGAPRGGHLRDGTGSSAVPSLNHRADHSLPRRPIDKSRESGSKSSTIWAEPTPLLTDALKVQKEKQAASRTNTTRFLKDPVDGEEFSAIGFYQWPTKEGSPEDLLGEQLKELDHLKTGWRVFVYWHKSRNIIKILAPPPAGQTAILEVIKGIRQAVENARTHANMTAPIYIVATPQHSTESTLLVAQLDRVARSDGSKHVYDIKFSQQSSDEELKKQSRLNLSRERETARNIRTELSKSLNELKHLKDGMRMRVYFGELHLTHWQTVLTDGKQTYENFAKMMKRTRTTGVFEKFIDPRVALYMMGQVRLKPENFMVWSAVDYKLSDVKPKHIAILTVQNSLGEIFQIEADIDKAFEEYQCGAVKIIEEERRNTCVEIITVDIEQVDWKIEVVSETPGTTPDNSFQTLIESCLKPYVRTGLKARGVAELQDKYGLKYPRIAPRDQPDLRIDKVTLQSLYRFKTRTGGYCLEIAFNRNWIGSSTVPEPEVTAGVSMFHDLWDTEMEPNSTTADRDWRKDMSNFFPKGPNADKERFDVFMGMLKYLLTGFHQSKSKFNGAV